jgi:hypothetical protein
LRTYSVPLFLKGQCGRTPGAALPKRAPAALGQLGRLLCGRRESVDRHRRPGSAERGSG